MHTKQYCSTKEFVRYSYYTLYFTRAERCDNPTEDLPTFNSHSFGAAEAPTAAEAHTAASQANLPRTPHSHPDLRAQQSHPDIRLYYPDASHTIAAAADMQYRRHGRGTPAAGYGENHREAERRTDEYKPALLAFL